MGRQKPLQVLRRLESRHDPLSPSGRLMGILRPIGDAIVLTTGTHSVGTTAWYGPRRVKSICGSDAVWWDLSYGSR